MVLSRRLGIAVLALTTSITLASCTSQDGGPSGDPPGGDPTSEQSSGSTDSAEIPADWQEAGVEGARLHLPQSWTLLDPQATSVGFAAPVSELGFSAGGGSLVSGVGTGDENVAGYVDRSAKSILKSRQEDPNVESAERLPDTEINGVLFSRIRWETSQSWDIQYVTQTPDGGHQLGVIWKFTKSDIDRKDAQTLIDPVMATFELL